MACAHTFAILNHLVIVGGMPARICEVLSRAQRFASLNHLADVGDKPGAFFWTTDLGIAA